MFSPDGKHDLDALLPQFRLTSFRPGQVEVIETVMSGRDCLCVMPTGGGKSLCYQLPAIALDGLTLVVSPLIALMKDQVDQLDALGLPVTFINSTLSVAEQHQRLDNIAAGQYRLVYVVPERFRSSRFLEAVRSVGLKLLAIDEAHCISEWGHDFRPDYARLGHFRHMLGNPTTIALTATATDAVRRDIVEQLDLNDPRTFITGFARPNLFYEVRNPRTDREKNDQLIKFLRDTPGSGIIYASSRKRTEEVAELVAKQTGRKTVAYHAGLLPDLRKRAQESFMKSRIEIVVATTAFGMGIDKADVRFVVHYNLPGTLEGYYQEAGRAGRDGKPSRCLLLYNPADRYVQEFFIQSAYPDRNVVAQVYEYLRALDADPIEQTQQDIKESLGLPITADGVGTCEQWLETAGVLERLVASENRAMVRLDSDLPTLVDLLPKRATTRRRVLQAVEKLVGTRRDEIVYFRPGELLETADLDQAAIGHALRQLNELDVFTYVPPFRGRAIRMIRRDQSFGQLDIDFETAERRKAGEYEKLNRVMYFATSPRCRQREILKYFGDPSNDACNHCDNCRRMGPTAQHQTDAEETVTNDEKISEAVRMVLSGVARAKKQMGFSCGKNLIAQMLCGSTSARMEKFRLNGLSTYGLLSYLKQPEVAILVDGLIVTGHLQQNEIEPRRPVVELTSRGIDVMMGTAELDVALPIPIELLAKLRGISPASRTSEASLPEAVDLAPVDSRLLAALKQWRTETAAESHLPPHYVLANVTLDELARRRPDSFDGLLSIKGIGPAKLERYGQALLELLSPDGASSAAEPSSATEPESEPPASTPEPPPPAPIIRDIVDEADDPEPRSPYYWTWRLLVAGFRVDECAAIRGLAEETVFDQALQAVEEGRRVMAEWCLDATLLVALEALVDDGQTPPIRSLLAQLPSGTKYEEVDLFLKCREQGS